ncbi:glutathione S-transferase family protein [Oculatella sp. LEGE 06141]|nr:glutathione S-transferase family protein [Oculatella sp. LEGE 06141]MBE9180499.1 glutathione S-transferase family protein [Oculatella sp. LEGE 06141]
MLELYQFELSHYCEKVRLILDYKGLAYRKIEVTPGIGQVDLFRLSGQRQVPVLKDGNEVIADSTAIALYLDRKFPDRPILPADAKQRALCLLMEEWADESIGLNSRKVMLGAFNQSPELRLSSLPASTPDLVRNLVKSFPREVFDVLGAGVGLGAESVRSARKAMEQNLESLNTLLQDSPYLVSDQPTLADFAVAGLTMYIKFPDIPYLAIPDGLKGKGVPGLADVFAYSTFWEWRDRLYADFRKPPISATPPASSAPTSIDIE